VIGAHNCSGGAQLFAHQRSGAVCQSGCSRRSARATMAARGSPPRWLFIADRSSRSRTRGCCNAISRVLQGQGRAAWPTPAAPCRLNQARQPHACNDVEVRWRAAAAMILDDVIRVRPEATHHRTGQLLSAKGGSRNLAVCGHSRSPSSRAKVLQAKAWAILSRLLPTEMKMSDR
jgi:hypothetical protein